MEKLPSGQTGRAGKSPISFEDFPTFDDRDVQHLAPLTNRWVILNHPKQGYIEPWTKVEDALLFRSITLRRVMC